MGVVVERFLRAGALLLGVVSCVPGPPRSGGPSYEARDDPYLSSRATAAIDREEDPVHRLILIGDAGAPSRNDPTLAALGRWGDVRPRDTTVLFLGDNVYPEGVVDADRTQGERVLRQLLGATAASKVFIPGNHDWGFSAAGAMQVGTLRNQQRFIDANQEQGAEFLPRDGCPGPVAKTLVAPGGALSHGLTLLIVDFHWWLLEESQRPGCAETPDTAAFLENLGRALEERAGETVVVAAHHPLLSGGPHGGSTRGFWLDVGAGFYYRLRGPIQDLWEPGYAQMIRVVSEVLAKSPPLAYVAGHDHSLQILDGGPTAGLMLVSGAGSLGRLTRVTALEETIFAHSHAGFMVLDFFGGTTAGEAVLLRVVETGKPQPVLILGVDLETPPPVGQAQEDRAGE
jgi:hypothetical protein